MKPLIRMLPTEYNFDFVGKRKIAAVLSGIFLLASVGSLMVQGLNFGIDFAGGILVEVRAEQEADLAAIRTDLNALEIGDVSVTTFGDTGRDVLIRVGQQEGGDEQAAAALQRIQQALGDGYEYRRTELVGPKVGQELIIDGVLAVTFAILAICVYIWFRFEWQFAVGATIALTHDVIATMGLFSLTQMDFNLTTVAAVLTIAGYSINDTVVAYDRVREKLRKYKKMELPDLLNLAANKVLTRTLMTSLTTLVAVFALFVFGGEVLRGFAIALMFGVVIGTYSSIFVAMPVLIYFNFRQEDMIGSAAGQGAHVPENERTQES